MLERKRCKKHPVAVERLLQDARAWAQAQLKPTASEVQDVFELKNRVVTQTYDRFVPNPGDFPYLEFVAALWEEGWPSLEDRAIEAILERATSGPSGAAAGSLCVDAGVYGKHPSFGGVSWNTDRELEDKLHEIREVYLPRIASGNPEERKRELVKFVAELYEAPASKLLKLVREDHHQDAINFDRDHMVRAWYAVWQMLDGIPLDGDETKAIELALEACRSHWYRRANQMVKPIGQAGVAERAMAGAGFWKQRQTDFLTYAVRFAELSAKWNVYRSTWILWWGSTTDGVRIPPEVAQALNDTTRKAVIGLPSSGIAVNQEAWRSWLDFMRAGAWRGFSAVGNCAVSEQVWEAGVKVGRPPVVVRRELGLSTHDEPEADHWLKELGLDGVFRESADFCEDLVRVLELVTPGTQRGATENQGQHGIYAVGPGEPHGAEEQKDSRPVETTKPNVSGPPQGDASAEPLGRMVEPPFRQGAKERPHLYAHWDSDQKLWTLHNLPKNKLGKPDIYGSVLADPETTRFLREACRMAISRLRQSRDPEVRALPITLRDPLNIWLDLMRTKERGFRRIPQLTRWRGGKSMEEFLRSGVVPTDARLTENGNIAKLFQESAAFWDDLVDIGFNSEAHAAKPADTRPQPPSATDGVSAGELKAVSDLHSLGSRIDPKENSLVTAEARSTVPTPDPSTSRWEDIEIRFTSDHRIQVFFCGKPGDAFNFGDMGFNDRRGDGGKPIRAWAFLSVLAQNDGIYPATKISGNQTVQKRAQEIRERLASHFRLDGDPLPFVEGLGYRSRFKIKVSGSFNT
jgi:hypothetical protein